MEEVKKRIHEIEEGTVGTVHIGVSSACSNMLIDFIAQFRAQFSRIKINIFSGDSEGLLRKLKQKEIDIALLIKPIDTEQYDMKNLKKQPPILIVPKSWTTSLTVQPTIKEIAHFPFIMLGSTLFMEIY